MLRSVENLPRWPFLLAERKKMKADSSLSYTVLPGYLLDLTRQLSVVRPEAKHAYGLNITLVHNQPIVTTGRPCLMQTSTQLTTLVACKASSLQSTTRKLDQVRRLDGKPCKLNPKRWDLRAHAAGRSQSRRLNEGLLVQPQARESSACFGRATC